MILDSNGNPIESTPKKDKKESLLLSFLKHPLTISFFSIILGSGILTYLNDQRKQEEEQRKIKFDFLVETYDDIQSDMASIFGIIKSEDVTDQDISNISRNNGVLYKKRMKVKLYSEAILKNPEFYKNYEEILYNLNDIKDYLKYIVDSTFNSDDSLEIVKDNKRMIIDYKVEPDTLELKAPYNEFYIWSSIVFQKASDILEKEIKKITK